MGKYLNWVMLFCRKEVKHVTNTKESEEMEEPEVAKENTGCKWCPKWIHSFGTQWTVFEARGLHSLDSIKHKEIRRHYLQEEICLGQNWLGKGQNTGPNG